MNIFELDEWCLEYAKNLAVPVCKGESKQQMATNNAIAQQQFASQQKQLAQYNDYVKQILSGGGYLPGVKEALTSQAIQSVPQNYNQAAQQLQTVLASRGATGGGDQPGSGLLGRGLGALYSSEEQNKSNLLNNITAGGQNNITAAEGGVLNAAGINTQGGTGALGDATSAANQANQSSGLLGTILGAGIGAASKLIPIPKCYVAAELYGGWLAPETVAIRSWLGSTWYMQPFTVVYTLIGERWADWIKRNPGSRLWTKKLFDVFLRKANG